MRWSIYAGKCKEDYWTNLLSGLPNIERVRVIATDNYARYYHIWHLLDYSVTLEHVASSDDNKDYVTLYGKDEDVRRAEEDLRKCFPEAMEN